MKKTSIIVLILMPIIAFAIIAVSGIIINDAKYIDVEEINITSPKIFLIGKEKYIIANKIGEQFQLTYQINPDNATDQDVVWEVVTGNSYATIDEFGIVTILSSGEDVVITLSNTSGKRKTDRVTIITKK